jgi:hypothetical protein
MFTNYLIYFYALPKEQKLQQIVIFLIFFLILFAVCVFLKFLKFKFSDSTKNSLFQRFLKRL